MNFYKNSKLKESFEHGSYDENGSWGEPGYYQIDDEDLREYDEEKDSNGWTRPFNKAFKNAKTDMDKENLKKFLSRPENVRWTAGRRDIDYLLTESMDEDNLNEPFKGTAVIKGHLEAGQYQNAKLDGLKFAGIPTEDQTADSTHGNEFEGIPYRCFANATGLESETVNIPYGIKKIGAQSFEKCKIGKLVIPTSVDWIAPEAFAGSNVNTLVILTRSMNDLEDFFAGQGLACFNSGLEGTKTVIKYSSSDVPGKLPSVSRDNLRNARIFRIKDEQWVSEDEFIWRDF